MIRFDDFMQAALYHPERGYYTSRIQTVGSEGDFTTTPQLSQSLAKAIADAFQRSGEKNLIEVGPGSGRLSQAVRQALPLITRLRTRHSLVEVSPILRELQRARLPRIQHAASLREALHAADGRAFIFSNELVDAFPVRIFRPHDGGFDELYLSRKEGVTHESFRPASDLPDSSQLITDGTSPRRIEVHESYHHWLTSWMPCFHRGQLLTIDYAVPDRPPVHGSLRAYYRQQRLTGASLYQNAGMTDLTADVSFQDLQRWGRQLGLETRYQINQSEFLAPFSGKSTADQFLREGDGAGTAFQVLLQNRLPS